MAEFLELTGVQVVFDGFKALDLARFAVPEKQLRVVIGPNGAGKTTLCDVISGKTKATRGSVVFDGRELTTLDEETISRLGVGRKFQTPTVFDSLTVFENMELALPGGRRVLGNFTGSPPPPQRERIAATLERTGLADRAAVAARHLSHGQRQWLEIAMLILQDQRLLLVDEPAAGLTDEETLRTARLLTELAGRHTLIVIEHDMEFVRELGAPVTVLNEGSILCEGTLSQVQKDERVIEAYLGR
jgi:urea transport system ATP-binding protein